MWRVVNDMSYCVVTSLGRPFAGLLQVNSVPLVAAVVRFDLIRMLGRSSIPSDGVLW